MKTVHEVQPSIMLSSGYSIVPLCHTYFWSLVFAAIGFLRLSYRVYKNAHPAEVLLFTWSTVMLLAAMAQIRFNYYLAINVALLAGGYFIYPILDFLSILEPQRPRDFKLQKTAIVTIFCLFAFLTVGPTLMLLLDKNLPAGLQVRMV